MAAAFAHQVLIGLLVLELEMLNKMPLETLTNVTVAEAYLHLLADRGVDCLFANAGTDFAPLIEAYVKAGTEGRPLPRPIAAAHENVAISMALGFWMVTGRPQACMVHVNVGTANAICGLLNAARGHIPVLFSAGRTPITEADDEGSRNLAVHWMQEMYDQAGMVREAVKWEYELRSDKQLETVVDRALSISNSEPKGPVYLTLPREVLAKRIEEFTYSTPSRHGASTAPFPDLAAIETAARLIAEAKFPLIVTSRLGADVLAPPALAALIDQFAIPVVESQPSFVSLAANHPMHAGYDVYALLAEADLVVVIDSAVPWIPGRQRPNRNAKVIQIGVDPIHCGMPIRGFECDLAITSLPSAALRALHDALSRQIMAPSAADSRRQKVAHFNEKRQRAMSEELERVKHQVPIHPVWLSHCLGQVMSAEVILMRESPQLLPSYLALNDLGTSFTGHAAGGLGWGLGAGIGAKIAAPEKTVIVVEGDGSYMFSVPTAAHHAALEQNAPFLTVIMDNHGWNEVHAATVHVYPEGYAARSNKSEPLTYFSPNLTLERAVEVAGGVGLRVIDPAALPQAIEDALAAVRQGRQAVLNVVCSSATKYQNYWHRSTDSSSNFKLF